MPWNYNMHYSLIVILKNVNKEIFLQITFYIFYKYWNVLLQFPNFYLITFIPEGEMQHGGGKCTEEKKKSSWDIKNGINETNSINNSKK